MLFPLAIYIGLTAYSTELKALGRIAISLCHVPWCMDL